MKDEKVAGVAGGFFGAICISGSYLHGRARSNEKTMGEGGEEKRHFSPRPLSHRFLVAPRSGFRTTVSPTYQPQKKKQNKKKTPAVQPG